MKLKGTVTVSLEDYHALLETHEINISKLENITETARELSVFLSYLASRADIERHVEKFNLQSTTSKILFKGDKAMITFRKIKDENNI
jgi:hypothetical protein